MDDNADKRNPALAAVGPLLMRRSAERAMESLLATPGLLLPAPVPTEDEPDRAMWRYGRLFRKIGTTAIVTIKGICIPSKDMGMAPWTNSYERTVQACAALLGEAKAGRVKEVIFDIDSPGGMVAGCQSAVAAIEALGAVVPTAAYVDGEACSAAFWQAAACRRMVITPTSGVGCIGVVMHFVIWNDDIVRIESVVSSQTPHKVPDVDNKDDRARLQRQVDAIADVFLSDLARLRRLPDAAAVAKQYALGDVKIGVDALALGMADEIAMLPAAFRTDDSTGGPAASPTPPAAGRKGATAMDPEGTEATATEATAEPDIKQLKADRDRLQAELTTAKAELATERAAKATAEREREAARTGEAQAKATAASTERKLEAFTALFEGKISADRVENFQKAAAARDAGAPDWFNSEFGGLKAGAAWPGGSLKAQTHGAEIRAEGEGEDSETRSANAVLKLAEKKGIHRNEAHAEIKGYAKEHRLSFHDAAVKLAG